MNRIRNKKGDLAKVHCPRGLCLRGYRKVAARCGRILPAVRFSSSFNKMTCRTCRRAVLRDVIRSEHSR